MLLTKYYVTISDEESDEEALERVQDNIFKYVEGHRDISATIIAREDSKQIEVKILKLNEHSN